ncbi:YibE/F family protein [Desulforamulus reducens MI-1]|uniref:YibE/F family protein n=1 Tax=Desulforamulus reducens (strain ATCC BAA-1160 / DSM 100696 / MI-1) TaxID=349161 RepID=A4J818_DESRM|nr:YibE/F family protein [Desulforamulus reducens]ABO51221.1 YibE/F family protein [Desulforamulus reducens MI-1]
MQRKVTGWLIVIIAITVLLGGQACWANETDTVGSISHEPEIIVRAKVLEVSKGEQSDPSLQGWIQGEEQLVTARVLNGDYKGKQVDFFHVIPDNPGMAVVVKPGDEVVLSLEVEAGKITNAFISDHARDKKLYILAVFFVLLMVAIGGLKGAKSVLALTITGVGIFYILLPMMFKGHSPILLTVLVAAVMTTITMVLVHGFNLKTLAGIIGTTSGVITAGILAMLVGKAAKLTGFSSEEMQMLLYIPQQIKFDYQGLLFAGMIIGALGAVMDVGISIASAVEEVKRVNPALDCRQLIRAGMNVGRDVMGTMANTLILAYTGGALPLILIFMAYDMPFLKIINLDLIATEVVRALTGSIGLVLAIPVTSVAAGLLFTKVKKKQAQTEEKAGLEG